MTLATPEMMTMAEALEAARTVGETHGRNGASWTFDGNTDRATYEAAVKGLDAGDPVTYDQLGGNEPHFGDHYSTRDLCDEIGVDYDLSTTAEVDQVADAYLDAAREVYWREVERVARYQTAPDDEQES